MGTADLRPTPRAVLQRGNDSHYPRLFSGESPMLRTVRLDVLALSLLAALASLGAAHASAQSRTFTATSGSRIQFVSDAPLERTTGTSSTVNGSVTIDPTNLATVSGRITVPVTSLHTG